MQTGLILIVDCMAVETLTRATEVRAMSAPHTCVILASVFSRRIVLCARVYTDAIYIYIYIPSEI